MNEMKPGIRYIITKTCPAFRVGDRVWLATDGKLQIFGKYPGWLEPDQIAVATKGWQIEPDREWIANRRAKLKAELAVLGGVDNKG